MKMGSRFATLAVAALAVMGGITACEPAPVVTLAQRQTLLQQEVASPTVFWNMYAHRSESPNNTFYNDMKAECQTHNVVTRQPCMAAALTYNEAVKKLGT